MPEKSEEKAAPEAKEEDVAMEVSKEENEDCEKEEKTVKAEDAKEEDVKEEDAKEGEGAQEEKPAEKEKPKELEEDAPEDTRPKVAPGEVAINVADTTLNVMPTADNKLLMALSEGGMQYLLASARATTGMKSGRYFFETRIVESLNPTEPQGERGRNTQPNQLLRVGLSLAGSSVFLADTNDSVCFDSEGFFVHGKKRAKCSSKFYRDQTVALLVNLDTEGPNANSLANTVSLFVNGKRVSPPRKLPEALVGKTLFPTVTYRNVSVHMNFGPVPRSPLPFTCRMLGDAAKADVEMVDAPLQPEPGKCEVILPVGMPNKGYFDWVDDFVSRNPGYTELSDRKILEWASKSGIWRQKSGTPGSNDKPDLKFGIPLMDDNSVRKAIAAIAPSLRRNYVVPELRVNLLVAERKKVLARFSSHDFKRRAIVMMGEPSARYKEKVQQLVLADKKAKIAAEKKKKLQEEERKRLLEERKRKAEEVKKAKDAAQKRKAGKAAEDEDKEDKEEEEEKEEEEPKEDTKMDEEAVELTEEEKCMWFRKTVAADIEERTLTKAYANFTLPTTEESLDEVLYDWADETACAKELKDWILQQKVTQRVEDLMPGEWFKAEWAKWQKQVQDWRRRQGEWKDPAKRKAYMAKKKEELKKKKEDEAKEAGVDAKSEEEAKPEDINAEDLDVFSVDDVADIGNGEPLFANFVYEDWTLLAVRYEFHLMLHAFKKDLDDNDRPSFGETHAAFYYNRYFKKTLTLKHFNLETFAGLVDLIQDTIKVAEADNKFLQCLQDEDASFATFMKLAEDNRRDRQRRLDAGDETAKLKFNKPSPAPPPKNQSTAQQSAGGGSKYGGSQGNSRWSDSGRGGGNNSKGATPAYSSSNKRPYTPSSQSAYGASSKYQRTGGGSGGGGGGGGNYYRR